MILSDAFDFFLAEARTQRSLDVERLRLRQNAVELHQHRDGTNFRGPAVFSAECSFQPRNARFRCAVTMATASSSFFGTFLRKWKTP
jgi:hypothetical protein